MSLRSWTTGGLDAASIEALSALSDCRASHHRIDDSAHRRGAFDWVGTLASNRRLVFVASGMGSQIVPVLFRIGHQEPVWP